MIFPGERLREKLKDPEFRKIEGFPIGSDEDILALSDPPYYTACPNPFLEDFHPLPWQPTSRRSPQPGAICCRCQRRQTDPNTKHTPTTPKFRTWRSQVALTVSPSPAITLLSIPGSASY